MHLSRRYNYYENSYAQYVQRRNIILGVCLGISLLIFLVSLKRYLRKRRQRLATQQSATNNPVQANQASNDPNEPKLDYTYPPHQNGQNTPYPNYTPDTNQQNQPYPSHTPGNVQQNQSYHLNSIPHYNTHFGQNNQAPQGTFPGGFMPPGNAQQFGYPPQPIYPPQVQVYSPENTQLPPGANSQTPQYPPSSQPTLNQRTVETPSSPVVEPVSEITKQSPLSSPKQKD